MSWTVAAEADIKRNFRPRVHRRAPPAFALVPLPSPVRTPPIRFAFYPFLSRPPLHSILDDWPPVVNNIEDGY